MHLCTGSWKPSLPFTYLWQCPTRIHIKSPTKPPRRPRPALAYWKQLHFQLLPARKFKEFFCHCQAASPPYSHNPLISGQPRALPFRHTQHSRVAPVPPPLSFAYLALQFSYRTCKFRLYICKVQICLASPVCGRASNAFMQRPMELAPERSQRGRNPATDD